MVRAKVGTVMRWCAPRWGEPEGEWTEWGLQNEEGRGFHR